MSCNNYRANTLLNGGGYRILTSLTRKKLEPYNETAIEDYQYVFWRNRSTIDDIHNINSGEGT